MGKTWAFVDSIDKDQAAQSVQPDLDPCRPFKSRLCNEILCGSQLVVFVVVEIGRVYIPNEKSPLNKPVIKIEQSMKGPYRMNQLSK